MNAYELADKLNEYDKDGLPVLVVGQAATMLRQQAKRIEELEVMNKRLKECIETSIDRHNAIIKASRDEE